MSAAEALSRLAAAGRIRSAWLPGMLAHNADGLVRVDVVEDGLPHVVRPDYWKGGCSASEIREAPEPVADDPATTGCLLALLREAVGSPYLSPTWNAYLGRKHDPEAEDDDSDNDPEGIASDNALQWRVPLCGVGDEMYDLLGDHVLGEGPTDYAAIEAALAFVAARLA